MPMPKLRVARPTDNLGALKAFYVDGLGFKILYEFSHDDGFDGLMVGDPRASYHLEFTAKRGHAAGRAPTEDNLLVLYLPDKIQWESAVQDMRNAGFDPVVAFNPYWDRSGRTFEDPDGYRVVLQNDVWE